MKSIVCIVTALFMVGTTIEDTSAAVLRPAITVNADVVRLGDLFADAGKKQDTVVATAPAPGAHTTFSAGQLQSIARRAGISWRPNSRYEKAVVSRAGRLISAREIESKLRKSMIRAGMPADRQLALSKSDFVLHMPAGDHREFKVTNPRFNVQGRQFSAILEVPSGTAAPKRVQVTGSMYEVINVPVLQRRVPRGDTIRASDLDTVKIRRNALSPNAIIDENRIIGRTPRRILQTGKPMQTNDLRLPFLVSKGKMVMLTVRNKHMLITARGRALESGAKGDVVRVTNTRSRNTIQGIVDGPNRVIIDFPGVQP
jgi:flagella basal body P-ring formation protein FlgA